MNILRLTLHNLVFLNKKGISSILVENKRRMFDVAAFGNPLLDITLNVTDNETVNNILRKYDFKDNDQAEITASHMKLLYEDLKLYATSLSPGGCAQNTVRVFQWLLQKPNKTTMFGSIGNDERGNILTKLVEESGVKAKYLIHTEYSTGTCVVLVQGTKRSLIAHLGAAEYFNMQTLTDEYLDILKNVKICYIEAFFLTRRLELSHYIKGLCSTNKSVLAFNLCASYMIENYPKDIINFAENCDILFGNFWQYKSLGEIYKIDDPVKVAIEIHKSYKRKEINSQLLRFGKIIIITNENKTIYCVFGDGEVQEFEVPIIPLEKIIDTNAAGDSFAGGFLAGLMLGYELQQCVKLACWAAAQIIQQSGCTLPNFTPNIQTILQNSHF